MRRRRGNESRKHGNQKSSGSVRPCFRETAISVVIAVQHFLPPSPVRRGMTQKFCALPPSGVTVSTIRPGLAWPGQPERQSQHRTHQQVKGNEQGPDGPEPPVATHPFLPSFLSSFLRSCLVQRAFVLFSAEGQRQRYEEPSQYSPRTLKQGGFACLLACFFRSFFLSFFLSRTTTNSQEAVPNDDRDFATVTISSHQHPYRRLSYRTRIIAVPAHHGRVGVGRGALGVRTYGVRTTHNVYRYLLFPVRFGVTHHCCESTTCTKFPKVLSTIQSVRYASMCSVPLPSSPPPTTLPLERP